MSDLINMHLLEMLASKICHDLISPIGAVNNGLEILEEMGADAGPEVIELISFSAIQASAKLRAFRLIYGAGGGDSNLTPQDAFTTIQSIISADNKITQDWNAHSDFDAAGDWPRGYCKVLTSVLMLALECLPKGGTLKSSGSEKGFNVIASGGNAGMRATSRQALDVKVPPQNMEPQAVHAVLTTLIADHYGFDMNVQETPGSSIEFHVSVR